jgi:hypothetical protein
MDFPAVTICSPGMSLDNLEAGFYKLLFAYFAANNVSVAVSPYNASTLLAKVKHPHHRGQFHQQAYIHILS